MASDPSRQVRHGVLGLVFTGATGLAGYMVLCDWSFLESLYMLVITISTVGYAEIGPATPMSRWVSMYVIILGITAAAYTFGGALTLMAEGQVRRIVSRQLQSRKIDSLKDHHIVCGFGRMGAMICEDLHRHAMPFVLVELNPERIAMAGQAGYLFVQGDATEEEILRRAGIERARSIVCVLPSDSDNVFVALTGRNMNERLFITARAEQISTEKKLKQAGADRVVAPQVIGAQRITNLLTRPTTVEILELVTGRQSVDLEMNEIVIPAGGVIHGQTLAQAGIRAKTGVIVVAIKNANGDLVINPSVDVPIQVGDTVVILGKRENIDSFRRQFAS